MKLRHILVAACIAVWLPLVGASASPVTPSVPQALLVPQALPAPLQVTVTFVEASAKDVHQAALSASGAGSGGPAQMLALLSKAGAAVTSFPIVTCMADLAASTERTQKVPFLAYANGKPQANFLSVVTGATIVPHQEAGGFVLLDISTTISKLGSWANASGVPSTITNSIQTRLHFRNGQTKMLAGSTPGASPLSQETLVFVTVNNPSPTPGNAL